MRTNSNSLWTIENGSKGLRGGILNGRKPSGILLRHLNTGAFLSVADTSSIDSTTISEEKNLCLLGISDVNGTRENVERNMARGQSTFFAKSTSVKDFVLRDGCGIQLTMAGRGDKNPGLGICAKTVSGVTR